MNYFDTGRLLRAIENQTAQAFNKVIQDSEEWRQLYPVLNSFISAHGYYISVNPKESNIHLELYVQSVYRHEDRDFEPLFSSVSEAACFEYVLNQIKDAQPLK